MKVLKMHDDLFIQRQRVIKSLYEARKVAGINLPRIKIRIVDFEKERGKDPDQRGYVLGRCFINKDHIVISHLMNKWDDEFLTHVVWHELAHAYFNAKHDTKCPLMHPESDASNLPSMESITKAFRSLVKEYVKNK